MPNWHEEHRGYRICYLHNQIARVARPGSELTLSKEVHLKPGEGRDELRRKAHAIIEEDIRTRRPVSVE